MNAENVIYFDSFRVEKNKKKNRKIIGKRNIITNIFRIQEYGSITGGYFCIGFIDFRLKGKS